jgi:uncharacterized protein YndB with AHSA1/START domain
MPRNAVAPSASTLTLPSDTEVQIVRSFAAPRDLVWRAFTDPKLLPKWCGPAGNPMTICEMDVRPGGTFRWGWGPNGSAFMTGGVFHQVETPRLLVMESRHPDPTPEVRSHTFEEKAGRTTVTIRIATATKALRDELLASGAVEGLEPTYAQLDALLAGLK